MLAAQKKRSIFHVVEQLNFDDRFALELRSRFSSFAVRKIYASDNIEVGSNFPGPLFDEIICRMMRRTRNEAKNVNKGFKEITFSLF